jgi:AraC-like DNA-binding protein
MTRPRSPLRVQLDTADVRPEQRLGAIRDAYAAAMMKCSIDPLTDGPVWSRMAAGRYGDLGVLAYSGAPFRCVADGSDAGSNQSGIMLDLVVAGGYGIRQGSRDTVVRRGEAVLYFSNMPFSAQSSEPVPLHSRSVMIPDKYLRDVAADPAALAGLHLGSDILEIGMLKGYLTGLQRSLDTADTAFAALVGRQLGELVVGAVARATRKEDPFGGQGLKSARLSRIMQLIDAQLEQPTLNASRIARQLGVSERYVQKLMEMTGTTFSECVMDKRLRRAWQVLAENRAPEVPVREVGWSVGFSDASHFTRAFRNRFGETPTAVRGSKPSIDV